MIKMTTDKMLKENKKTKTTSNYNIADEMQKLATKYYVQEQSMIQYRDWILNFKRTNGFYPDYYSQHDVDAITRVLDRDYADIPSNKKAIKKAKDYFFNEADYQKEPLKKAQYAMYAEALQDLYDRYEGGKK